MIIYKPVSKKSKAVHIHALLVIAIVVVLFRIISGRTIM